MLVDIGCWNPPVCERGLRDVLIGHDRVVLNTDRAPLRKIRRVLRALCAHLSINHNRISIRFSQLNEVAIRVTLGVIFALCFGSFISRSNWELEVIRVSPTFLTVDPPHRTERFSNIQVVGAQPAYGSTFAFSSLQVLASQFPTALTIGDCDGCTQLVGKF
ncbi:hypothetical protein BKA82DRAFT_725564 [Pisolithus tinctorius]|uniref:Uncharacterized protein n=1 Tax=Pisolithus tinctorius Marx 270 TaxID=870435 RepID=A0A0C3P2R3_PISTI|nr:hypothetical protein BKA82DRAFT_725564 [Pisolithus tinctorius]KIO01786.1 hypothetical protein M404DRAFT_725564 [Pisolithus tinctorius Marx 270]